MSVQVLVASGVGAQFAAHMPFLTCRGAIQMSRKALILMGLLGGTMPYLALALTCDNAYYIPLSSLRYAASLPAAPTSSRSVCTLSEKPDTCPAAAAELSTRR